MAGLHYILRSAATKKSTQSGSVTACCCPSKGWTRASAIFAYSVKFWVSVRSPFVQLSFVFGAFFRVQFPTAFGFVISKSASRASFFLRGCPRESSRLRPLHKLLLLSAFIDFCFVRKQLALESFKSGLRCVRIILDHMIMINKGGVRKRKSSE